MTVPPRTGEDYTQDSRMGHGGKRRIVMAVTVPVRLCALCGKQFTPPVFRRGGVSRRATCSNRCANEMRGDSKSELHAQMRATDPDRYARWVGRDYSAMGRQRHEIKANRDLLSSSSKPVKSLSFDTTQRSHDHA